MLNSTCQWPECGRPSFARGLCQRCNMRARRAGTLHTFRSPDATCRQCGRSYPEGTRSGKWFCSADCQALAARERRAARRVAILGDRECRTCGLLIPLSVRSDANHCSVKCQQAAWYLANDERLKAAAREWGRLNPEQRARAGRAWYERNRERAAQLAREWRAANPDRVRASSRESAARRRARLRNAVVEDFTFAEMWLRDEGRCWICSHSVDPSTAWPDPMSPSIDHVIPLALGGDHTLSNCSLSHLRCNIRKGVRILDRPGLPGSEEDPDAMAAKSA